MHSAVRPLVDTSAEAKPDVAGGTGTVEEAEEQARQDLALVAFIA